MDDELLDRLAIRDIVENWAVWGDGGDWERFATVWHDDGGIMTTWWQGPGEEFVAARRAAWEADVSILHFLGGISVDVRGHRAIAQTKMKILLRGMVHDVMCDIECIGRFYDFFEKRDGRWGIVLRRSIYEKDRLDPLDPSAKLSLDAERLARFHEGYRHVAYFQEGLGYEVKPDMPGLKGAEVEAVYARGAAWLAGEPL